MLIRCPECGFERELDASQIPDSAVMATCPRCETRFRFRETVQPSAASGEAASAATPGPRPVEAQGDDPLPPGAITPDPLHERRMREEAAARQDVSAGADDPEEPDDAEKQAHFEAYLRQAKVGERNAGTRSEDGRSLFSGGGASSVPWECAGLRQLPLALYHTLLRALFSVPAFFTAVGESRASLLRPCLFFIILRLFESIMLRFWTLAAIREQMQLVQDPQTLSALEALSQNMNLILMVLIAMPLLLFQLLFYSGMLHMMLTLLQPDRANFSTTLRVVAYAAAPCVFTLVPLNYLTIPGLGLSIVSVWVAVCTFMGLKYAHRLTWLRTVLVTLPLYILGLIISWHFAKALVNATLAG